MLCGLSRALGVRTPGFHPSSASWEHGETSSLSGACSAAWDLLPSPTEAVRVF